MNTKLFLGIIIIFALISGMLMPIIEGVCNYEDETETSELQKGEYDGDADEDADVDGVNIDSLAIGKKGAPIKKRSAESCNESIRYQNEERVKMVRDKLNELKLIHKKTEEDINGNTKKIKQNQNNRNKMNSLVDDNDDGGENDACKKYPEAC
jgi:hypothetical protein